MAKARIQNNRVRCAFFIIIIEWRSPSNSAPVVHSPVRPIKRKLDGGAREAQGKGLHPCGSLLPPFESGDTVGLIKNKQPHSDAESGTKNPSHIHKLLMIGSGLLLLPDRANQG